MPGPPPRGDRAATTAERSAAYRARRKATAADVPAKPPVVIRYRRPADRRSRPQQWADAVQTLADLLGQFEEWETNCRPASRTARRRKHSMPCWSCAVMSKIFRRSSCQKASDGTDGGHRWRNRTGLGKRAGLAISEAVHRGFLKHVSFSVRLSAVFLPRPHVFRTPRAASVKTWRASANRKAAWS